jgi:hypothetical protein
VAERVCCDAVQMFRGAGYTVKAGVERCIVPPG